MSKQGLFKNFASLGIIQIANYALPLISVPIISRIIGPDKFGVINYAASFVLYFNLLIAYGFELSATRKIAQQPGNAELKNQVFSEVLSAKLFLFLVSVAVFIICLYNVPLLSTEKTVAIFSFSVCLGTVFSQNWLFQAMQDLPKMATLNFFGKLIITVLVIYFVKQKSDYIWQPLITGIIHVLIALVAFFWAVKRYNLKFQFVGLRNVLDVLMKEKAVFFSLVFINLYTTTNVVVLGLLENETAVGFYTAGQKLVDVIGLVVIIPLSQALFPVIGLAFAESREKGIDVVQSMVPLIILLTGCLGIGMNILGPTFLVWFYGGQFTPAILVFKVTTFTPMLAALSNLFGIQVMLNLKLDKVFLKITAFGALLGFPLNVLMIKLFGYVGTAWNVLIVEVLLTLTMYICLRKNGVNPINVDKFSLAELNVHVKAVRNKFSRK
jgi:PST family polysaccharide transporter